MRGFVHRQGNDQNQKRQQDLNEIDVGQAGVRVPQEKGAKVRGAKVRRCGVRGAGCEGAERQRWKYCDFEAERELKFLRRFRGASSSFLDICVGGLRA